MRSFLLLLLAPSFCFAWKHEDPKPNSPVVDKGPDWLSGTSAAYPRVAFLIGVGQGVSRDEAADRARGEVAKSFSVSVSALTEVSAEDSSAGSSERLSDKVRSRASEAMNGLEIAQYWQDPKGSFYALAVLDRDHSMKLLKDKLEEYDRDLKDLASSLAKTEGKFSRLKCALQLVQASKARKKINGDYRVLNPEGKGIAPPAELNDVVAGARKALSALDIQVAAEGDLAASIAARVIADLSAQGLKAGSKSDRNPDILLELKSSGEILPPENLVWFWAKGSISAKLSYGPAGEVFSRFEESGEKQASTAQTAFNATMLYLTDKAADHAYHAILSADLTDD